MTNTLTKIEWEPVPGHYPGQINQHVTYVWAEYRGLHVELYHRDKTMWDWSFYDENSWDPDLAVARGSSHYREIAELELTGYIDGYIID